jgi:DNA processing protein
MDAASTTDSIEIRAWLTWLRAPEVGPATLRMLRVRAGSAAGALRDFESLREEYRFSAATLAWLRAPDEARIATDLAWLAGAGNHFVPFDDPAFPPLLQHICAPPAALFVSGDLGLLWQPQVAIVGARSASAAGLGNARQFARSLAKAGFVITSGLADGIDGAAHAAALDADGRTVAVIGTGPDLVYPRKHRDLSAAVAQRGALVSEFPPGTPAKSDHFPRRNRLISGLSLGTLVVEASLHSGSLITARLAGDQGREVFAVPGSIHNPLARGCHRLIREGARLVESGEEVAADLAALAAGQGERLRAQLAPPEVIVAAPAAAQRDADYVRLLDALDHDPVGLDELAERTGLSIAALSSMLLVLELEGEISAAGAGRYARRAALR